MNQTYGVIINGKHFNVEADLAAMKQRAQDMIANGEWQEECYQQPEHGEPVTEANWVADAKKALADISALIENPALLAEVVEGIGFKKNGWLRLGGICRYKVYESLAYEDVESYGYQTYMLKAKATSDSHVVLRFTQDIIKW